MQQNAVRDKQARHTQRVFLFGVRYVCLMVFLCVLGTLMVPTQVLAQMLLSTSVQTDGIETTLSLEFDQPIKPPQAFFLENPQRFVLDIAGNGTRARILNASAGVVANVRTGIPKVGSVRVVADLAGPVEIASARLVVPNPAMPTTRVLIALRVVEPAVFKAKSGFGQARPLLLEAGAVDKEAPSPAPSLAATPTPTPALESPGVPGSQTIPATPPQAPLTPIRVRGRLPVVVLDAGHGGQDPGAPSVIPGRHESEVTLALVLAIRDELQKTGRYKVVLTRSTDVFIPLAERVNIARRAKADLFISVHADAIADPKIRGATVYTLSETASDKEAERLAAKENKADIIAGVNLGGETPDVANILIDLAQRETMAFSAEFALTVVREISPFTLLRTNFHRFAGFRVLRAPDVPSILLESGYMSNLEDSQFLFSREGQRSFARGVSQAIEAYFSRRNGPAS
jgi:N-acetylmuramoyl-L-alanine amidase